MDWEDGRRSSNIEDRRGQRAGLGLKLGGGVAIIVAIIVALLGGDPQEVLDQLAESGGGGEGGEYTGTAEEEELADFVSVVLADTEDTWNTLFPQMGMQYQEPVLVLFTDRVSSACGMQSAAVGPFYCPADNQVYIDLGFYRTMRERLGAPGDFAQAYVIAHEVGHHIQNLTGVSSDVNRRRQALSEYEGNQLTVRLELQADCYAGIWAHHADRTRGIVEDGDIEEALNAAHQIGDDTLQESAGQTVRPETFTHGTSEQRMRWFNTGYRYGDFNRCDTFSAQTL